MKKLLKFCAIALSAIFLSISANAEEGLKCKTGLDTGENTKVNASRLKLCWYDLEKASEKIMNYFMKSELYVFIYGYVDSKTRHLYFSATKDSEDETPAVKKGLELCAKDTDDCAVWSVHTGWELAEYLLHADSKVWIKHAMDRRAEMSDQ